MRGVNMKKVRKFNGNHFVRIASSRSNTTPHLKNMANQMRLRGYNARVVKNKTSSSIFIRPSLNRIKRIRAYHSRDKELRELTKGEIESRINELTDAMTKSDKDGKSDLIAKEPTSDLKKMLSSWNVDDVINEMAVGFDTLQRKSFTTSYGELGGGMSKPDTKEPGPIDGYDIENPFWSKEWVIKNDPSVIDAVMDETGDSEEEIMAYTDDELAGRIAYVNEDGGGFRSEIMQYVGNVAPNDTFYMATGQYIAPNETLYLNDTELENKAYESLSSREQGKKEIESLYDPSIGNRFGALSRYVDRAKNDFSDEVVMLPLKTWKKDDKKYGKVGGEFLAAVIHPEFLDKIYTDSLKKKSGKPIEYPTEFNLLSRLGGGWGGGFEDTEAFYKYMISETETVDEGWGFEEEIIDGESWDQTIYESTDLAFVNTEGDLLGVYSIPLHYKGDKLELLPAPARGIFKDENWYDGGVEKAYFRGEVIFDPEYGRQGDEINEMLMDGSLEMAMDNSFSYAINEILTNLKNPEGVMTVRGKMLDSNELAKIDQIIEKLESQETLISDFKGDELRLIFKVNPSFRKAFAESYSENSMDEREPSNNRTLADFEFASEYFEEGEWAVRMGLPLNKITRDEAMKYLEQYGALRTAEAYNPLMEGGWDGDGLLGDLLSTPGKNELEDRAYLTDKEFASKWNYDNVAMKNEKQFGSEIVFERP